MRGVERKVRPQTGATGAGRTATTTTETEKKIWTNAASTLLEKWGGTWW